MMAPPPMPNRPARMPVTTPPVMIAAASSTSSDHGMPLSTSGRDVGGFGARVRNKRSRLAQDLRAGAGLDRMRRDMAAEGARAGHPLKQPEHVASHCVEARTRRQFALDVR